MIRAKGEANGNSGERDDVRKLHGHKHRIEMRLAEHVLMSVIYVRRWL